MKIGQMRLPLTATFLGLVLSSLAVCSMLGGCAQGSSDDGDDSNPGTPPEGEREFSVSATADERGVARATVQLPADTTKFSVTAFVDSRESVRFVDFSDSNGNDFLSARGVELTFGSAFFPGVNTVVAPPRALDPALEPANSTYNVEVEVESGGISSSGAPVTLFVNSKSDGNLSSGSLAINLFFVGDVGQESDTKEVVALALQEFQRIYAASGSISLDVQEFDVEGPITLPAPFDGSAYYTSISEGARSPAINVFVSGDIEGGGDDVLGLAAGIPGPPIPSSRSAVAVGFFAAAGPDGLFSNEDVRILGETIAHETGHFMGLFHPVDFEGETVSASDPLPDTPTCSFFIGCLSDSELISNLMFFSPVSDGRGGFVQQNQITNDQRGVMNRYIVTD